MSQLCISVFCIFRAYILVFRLWPNELANRILSLSTTIPREGDPAHHRVATEEASTMTDSVQLIEEASPHPQISHAPTQTEILPVQATTDTFPEADKAPTLQTSHGSTPPLPPPVVMEQFAQTDTTSLPRTTQAATQTGPLLRNYRAELKAKIARSERLEKWHKETMGRLREQAANREAELKTELTHTELMAQQYNATMGQLREQTTSREPELAQRMEEHSVAMKAKEKEVLDLQVTLTDTKERILREEERNRQQEKE